MKKTATITFHAAHNYGSLLQAYALQKVLLDLGCENDIINLRTTEQKEMYPDPFDLRQIKSVRRFLSWIAKVPFWVALHKKHQLFEAFLIEELRLTKEYFSLDAISKAGLNYDCYISGSDQLWNTSCTDFDWSYYLPFVDDGKAISYAASMGASAENMIDPDNYSQIKKCLKKYAAVGVREKGTAEIVEKISGIKPDILVDPTLLVSAKKWREKIGEKPLVDGPYLFMYVPGYAKSVYQTAKKFGKLLNLKVVVSTVSRQWMLYPSFKTIADVGAWEFLNMLDHASFVLSGSFHATVFSVLFNKPFYAVHGMKDNRVSSLLHGVKLTDRDIGVDHIKEKAEKAFDIDFSTVDLYLSTEKKRSIVFLTEAIGI